MVLLQDRQFVPINTEARHAGIDMQYPGQVSPEPARLRRPAIDLRQRTEHRHETLGDELTSLPGSNPFSTPTIASGSNGRIASASSNRATKKWRHPAA